MNNLENSKVNIVGKSMSQLQNIFEVLGEKKFRATYKKEETVDIKEKSLKKWSIFFLPKEQGKDKRILFLKKKRGTSRSAICGLEALIPISPWQSFYGLQTSLYFWRLGGIMERSV